jgi:hypothetical protein
MSTSGKRVTAERLSDVDNLTGVCVSGLLTLSCLPSYKCLACRACPQLDSINLIPAVIIFWHPCFPCDALLSAERTHFMSVNPGAAATPGTDLQRNSLSRYQYAAPSSPCSPVSLWAAARRLVTC